MALDPSLLSKKEKELISSLDLRNDITDYGKALQHPIEEYLYELYSTGAVVRDGKVIEEAAPNPQKARLYGTKAGLLEPEASFFSKLKKFIFNTQNIHTAYAEANNLRLGTLRLNRFMVALRDSAIVQPQSFYYQNLMDIPVVNHLLRGFGLIYWLEFFTDMGIVFASTFIPARREHELNEPFWKVYGKRFLHSLTKDKRPRRIFTCLFWGSLNLAGILCGGGVPNLIITAIGFSGDVLLEIGDAILGLVPHITLHSKIWKEIKNQDLSQPNDLASLKLIQKKLIMKTVLDVAYYAYRIVSTSLILAGMVMIFTPAAPAGLALLATGMTLLAGSVFSGQGKSLFFGAYNLGKKLGMGWYRIFKSKPQPSLSQQNEDHLANQPTNIIIPQGERMGLLAARSPTTPDVDQDNEKINFSPRQPYSSLSAAILEQKNQKDLLSARPIITVVSPEDNHSTASNTSSFSSLSPDSNQSTSHIKSCLSDESRSPNKKLRPFLLNSGGELIPATLPIPIPASCRSSARFHQRSPSRLYSENTPISIPSCTGSS